MISGRTSILAGLMIVMAIGIGAWVMLGSGRQQAACWTKADNFFSTQRSQLLDGSQTAADANHQFCLDAETQFGSCLDDHGIGGAAATAAKEKYDTHRDHCAVSAEVTNNSPTVAF